MNDRLETGKEKYNEKIKGFKTQVETNVNTDINRQKIEKHTSIQRRGDIHNSYLFQLILQPFLLILFHLPLGKKHIRKKHSVTNLKKIIIKINNEIQKSYATYFWDTFTERQKPETGKFKYDKELVDARSIKERNVKRPRKESGEKAA